MSALPAPEARPESYAASLYERHNRAVFRHCLKQLRRREDADDATQTTFVYALLSLRRGVVPQAELAWLYTIASNVCSSSRRSWARRGALGTAQDVDALRDVIPMPDRSVPVTADEFRAALAAMPDTQRRALLLREWHGLSYSEIADKLGLTQSATETLLFRARRTLAGKLQEKAGAGLSIAGFVRSLLQSGAAKTIAVGLGATAITVAPSAERRPHHVPDASRAKVVSRGVVPRGTVAPRPELPASGTQTAKASHHATPLSAPGTRTEDGPPALASPVSPPSTTEPPTPATPEPQPEPSGATPSQTPTPTPSVVAVPPVGVPPVSVPPVPLPPLPVVEDVVGALPNIQLPAVTVPPLSVSLP